MQQGDLVGAIFTMAQVLDYHALMDLHRRISKLLDNGVPAPRHGGDRHHHHHHHQQQQQQQQHRHHNPNQPHHASSHQYHHRGGGGTGGGGNGKGFASSSFSPDRRHAGEYSNGAVNGVNNGNAWQSRRGDGGAWRTRGGGDAQQSWSNRGQNSRKWINKRDEAVRDDAQNGRQQAAEEREPQDKVQRGRPGKNRRDKRRPNREGEAGESVMSDVKSNEAGSHTTLVKDSDIHNGADGKQVVSQSIDRGVKKHPLNRSWTLWYDSVSTYDSQQWELSLVEVMTVHTVEDFFTMLHYCKPPHVLRVSAQYHFFREGVKPMWEDPNNKAGGKLWVSLDEKTVGDSNNKKWENTATNASAPDNNGKNNSHGGKTKKDEHESEKKPELDTIWESILMALVGEYLDAGIEGEHIMGVVLSKRKYHNRIALWLRNASATDAVSSIEKQLVKEAGLPPSAKFFFTPHGNGKS